MKDTTQERAQTPQTNMAMDITLWSKLIGYSSIKSYPLLPCPHCQKNELKLEHESIQSRQLSKESLAKNRKYKAEKAKLLQSSEPMTQSIKAEDITLWKIIGAVASVHDSYTNPINGSPHLLNCFFTCQSCQESVSASGIKLIPEKGFLNSDDVIPHVKFDHFSPPLVMFPISKNVPDSISEELFDAFKYFHFDPSSSAAKLRRAMERFCDHQQIEGNNLNRKVQNLAKPHPEEAMYLEALKLVGNEGTHGNNVDELDLLYAFQIFEFVLELYDRQARFDALQNVYDKLAEKVGKEKLQLKYEPPIMHEALPTKCDKQG
ncbi:DUF4145 domain-containing protein [Vibrio gazogenes]|uniref:DUF4145 domain-containing protein n=1 Tax=Vibrio gazogenes TaxID=687 RepID=A0A1Z2SE77_VIBGA|nr:DUF4145 domain-containing protein [Vibrio gazogenes]ASA55465.1 hypothetical protein BSQ33_06945 [Vibrio gazogenes]